jgi:hypothetical protein
VGTVLYMSVSYIPKRSFLTLTYIARKIKGWELFFWYRHMESWAGLSRMCTRQVPLPLWRWWSARAWILGTNEIHNIERIS